MVPRSITWCTKISNYLRVDGGQRSVWYNSGRMRGNPEDQEYYTKWVSGEKKSQKEKLGGSRIRRNEEHSENKGIFSIYVNVYRKAWVQEESSGEKRIQRYDKDIFVTVLVDHLMAVQGPHPFDGRLLWLHGLLQDSCRQNSGQLHGTPRELEPFKPSLTET